MATPIGPSGGAATGPFGAGLSPASCGGETVKLGPASDVWPKEAVWGFGVTAWWWRTTLFILWALLCPGTAAAQNTLTGRLVAVADGDTLTLLDSSNTQHRIRL